MTYFSKKIEMFFFLMRKLRGQPPEPPVTAKPCVGLCYLKRLNGEMEPTTSSKPNLPCIGLCYLEKIGKIVKNKAKEAGVKEEGDDEKLDNYDLEGSVEDDYEENYDEDK